MRDVHSLQHTSVSNPYSGLLCRKTNRSAICVLSVKRGQGMFKRQVDEQMIVAHTTRIKAFSCIMDARGLIAVFLGCFDL